MIIIEGLTARQRAFCDTLWNMETQGEVDSFIDSLPDGQQQECQTVLELIIAAAMDEFMGYDVAAEYLKKFQL
jgi:hypothetical protein